MMWNRLDVRLSVSTAWIIALALGAVTLFLVHQAGQEHLATLDDGLESTAWTLASGVRPFLSPATAPSPAAADATADRPSSVPGQPSREGLQAYIAALGRTLSVRLTVVDGDGHVVADTDGNPEKFDNHRNRPEIRAALSGEVGVSSRPSGTLPTAMRYVAVPVRDESGTVVGAVRAAVPLTAIERRQTRIYRFAAAAALVAFLLSLWAAARVSGAITRPLEQMSRLAAKMAQGDFRGRIPIPAPRELASLAESLHTMGERLDRLITELSREKSHLEAILNGMSDGVVAVDARLHVTLMNRAAAALFRIPNGEEAIGRHLTATLGNRELTEAFSATLADGSPRQIILDWHPDGGTPRVLQVATATVWNAALPLARGGVVALVRDVTELRRLERVRRDFVANVSHELRTPLTVLQGFQETLLDGDVAPEQQRRFLVLMERETKRMVSLVNDLLQLSQLESEGMPLKREPVDLRDIVRRVRDTFAETLAANGIRLAIHIGDDVPPVPAEPRLLEQVFHNLMSNAVRYMGEGGGTITVRADVDGNAVAVAVTDTGIGIPEEHLPRIFERFYRVDAARSRERGGTGLGLSIVRHIVERHGGRVRAESEVGKGTTISFSLPL